MQRTLILVKPDGVCKGLIGEIVKRLEEEKFKIVGLKMVWLDEQKANEFYQPHQNKPFFPGLIDFMLTAPCIAMVAEREDAIRKARELIGERIPQEAKVGSIRGDFGSDGRRNIVHGSDSLSSAKREIECFFTSDEFFSYKEEDWLNSEPG